MDNRILSILLALFSIILIGLVLIFYMKNKDNENVVKQNNELKNEVLKLKNNNDRIKKLIPSHKEKDNDSLMKNSIILVEKMMNTQNKSNYKEIKTTMTNISTNNFMKKFLKDDSPQYDRPSNTKISEVKLYIENDNNLEKKNVIVTFLRDAYLVDGNNKVQNKIISKNEMTLKINYVKNKGSWLIDDFKIIGDIPIGID
ncbi:hypothetical protein K4S71_09740 [Staphylococcus epidermidis]|nr:hypothetical protein [Staphylococcus epidermidis]MCG1591644.1 hypothetical protein [Staphylococcus epidermidis]MCG2478635.1 hypothetical protein [Staphylococcus epidermidis]